MQFKASNYLRGTGNGADLKNVQKPRLRLRNTQRDGGAVNPKGALQGEATEKSANLTPHFFWLQKYLRDKFELIADVFKESLGFSLVRADMPRRN